jgi:3-hydroxyacyl-CoA dehydrogenase/enoyl-CoA hydratase/3-hydroxybutyryl-CoA epimerase
VEVARKKVLAATLGHYPAPLAILDCIEQGLPQSFDAAIRTEMSIFSHLIQRPEPRNMIQTLFLGKLDHDRAIKTGELPERVTKAVSDLAETCSFEIGRHAAELVTAGFQAQETAQPSAGSQAREAARPSAVQDRASAAYWFEEPLPDPRKPVIRDALAAITSVAAEYAGSLSETERRIADYVLVTRKGFPAYLGGPFAMLAKTLS